MKHDLPKQLQKPIWPLYDTKPLLERIIALENQENKTQEDLKRLDYLKFEHSYAAVYR